MITKASKIETLKFIRQRGVIETWGIEEHFDYSHRYVFEKLRRLKQQGLIGCPKRGLWEVTDLGLRRLMYYGEKI